ncbi:hypothetical protein GQ600_21716 [Phytophthora cactorum]|nr:hypothetical protein GQ600_21716 [Phytophthora cactorum]
MNGPVNVHVFDVLEQKLHQTKQTPAPLHRSLKALRRFQSYWRSPSPVASPVRSKGSGRAPGELELLIFIRSTTHEILHDFHTRDLVLRSLQHQQRNSGSRVKPAKLTPATNLAVGNIHTSGLDTVSMIRRPSVYSTAMAGEATTQPLKWCFPDRIVLRATRAPNEMPMMTNGGQKLLPIASCCTLRAWQPLRTDKELGRAAKKAMLDGGNFGGRRAESIMQLEQPPGDYLVQQEVKRLIKSKRGDILLSTLFTWPIIVWAPECMNPLKSPSALSPDARVHLAEGVQADSGGGTRSAASNALSLYTYEEVWSFEGGNEACPRGYAVSTWIVKYCGKYQATSRKAILQVALLVCRSSATQYAVKPAVLISLSPIGRAVLQETESSRSVNAIGGLVGEVTHLQCSL